MQNACVTLVEVNALKNRFLYTLLFAIIIIITQGAPVPSVIASTYPTGGSGTHFCGVSDCEPNKRHKDQFPNRNYAQSFAANLNVGEPRTVRLIYFLPNDRPYQAEVVQRMKDEILNIQAFYADQMEAHGYGKMTFRVETDAEGEPKVHRVDGANPNSHYLAGGWRWDDIGQEFYREANNVFCVVWDNGTGRVGQGVAGSGGGGRNGGEVTVPDGFDFGVLAHELGHAFGLNHDFRDGDYIMSYGPGEARLSACAADYLFVHPYFNPAIPIEEGEPPTIEIISPLTYPPGATSVQVRLKVNDSDGLHQVLLHALGDLQMCRRLTGKKDAIIEFDYDGGFTREGFTSLSYSVAHSIRVEAVDMEGNVDSSAFVLAERSPYNSATIEGHGSVVLSVAFSPDGTILASGAGNAVRLWDVATRAKVATLSHTDEVYSVTFSPDGETLASGAGNAVRLWDMTTYQDISTLHHGDWVNSVSFSPDGETLAAGGGNAVRLWDMTTYQDISTLHHGDWVHSVSFSPDGETLAAGVGGDREGAVRLWDVTTRTNIATFEEDGWVPWVLSVAFSPDGAILASGKGNGDGWVKLWEVSTGRNVAFFEHRFSVNSVSFSPDGTILASGERDGTVKLWDVATRAKVATLSHTDEVYSVTFSPDGETLAAGTWAGTIELWDVSGFIALEPPLEIEIPDPNLRSAIEDALGVSPGTPINQAAMATLTDLDASNANISNLTGLESATELVWLYLGAEYKGTFINSNSVSDLSPLSGLTNLSILLLDHNSISDLSPLAGLTKLTYLELGNNSISDISPVSGLNNLTELVLWDNSISDLSPLVANTGLGEGDAVYVSGNPLSYQSINTHIPALLSRGINVTFENLKPPLSEYLLSIPADMSLIHVPLKVTAVEGVDQSVESIGDLYAALGGADAVIFLITYDPATGNWLSYFGASDRGTLADRSLTDEMGILANLKTPVSVQLTGESLGIDQSSTFTLHQGFNVVGLPLNDSRITRVSDLLRLDGIRNNVRVIIHTEGGDWQSVGRAGDPGDIEITGGQGFILIAQQTATVALSGEAWSHEIAQAAPLAKKGRQAKELTDIGDTTPVLAFLGAVVDEGTGLNRGGFRVTAKNLSTGRTVAGMTRDDGTGYQLTVVDIETGRAAQVGDILSISAQSPNPLIGVHPLRYTVTAEDVKRSLIQLPALVAYEILTETELLANYPNPFNPETWIPFRLAEDALVTLTIYDGAGHVVRTIDIGHRIAAVYEDRSKAIYWDGRNALGEQIASGVYFYQLSAGAYSATRKMVILK